MADPLGLYYSAQGQEVGLATVLGPRKQGDALDYIQADLAARRKVKPAEDKRITDLYKNEPFRHTGYLENILTRDINGMFDAGASRSEVSQGLKVLSDVRVFGKASEEDFGKLRDQVKTDPELNGQVVDFFNSDIEAIVNTEDIDKMRSYVLAGTPNADQIVLRPGGSSALNAPPVISRVVKQYFPMTEETQEVELGRFQALGGGAMFRDTKIFQSEMLQFVEQDTDGKLKIRDWSELQGNTLNNFKADARMNVLIRDRAVDVAQREGVEITGANQEEYEAKALQEWLSTYAAGTLKEANQQMGMKQSIDFGARRERQRLDGYDVFIRDLFKGDQQAFALIGAAGEADEGEIINAGSPWKVQKMLEEVVKGSGKELTADLRYDQPSRLTEVFKDFFEGSRYGAGFRVTGAAEKKNNAVKLPIEYEVQTSTGKVVKKKTNILFFVRRASSTGGTYEATYIDQGDPEGPEARAIYNDRVKTLGMTYPEVKKGALGFDPRFQTGPGEEGEEEDFSDMDWN